MLKWSANAKMPPGYVWKWKLPIGDTDEGTVQYKARPIEKMFCLLNMNDKWLSLLKNVSTLKIMFAPFIPASGCESTYRLLSLYVSCPIVKILLCLIKFLMFFIFPTNYLYLSMQWEIGKIFITMFFIGLA